MIVHVAFDCIPGRYTGGVSKVVYELARSQSQKTRTEIWVCNTDGRGTTVDYGSLRIRYLRAKSWGSVLSSEHLRSELFAHRNQISVLHGHNTFHPLNLQMGKFASKHKIPTFYHPHGALDPQLMQGVNFRAIKKRIYVNLLEVPNLNRAACVFALTQHEAAQLRSIGVRTQIKVIPNGIFFEQPPKNGSINFRLQNHIHEDLKIVLYVGRIVAKKGIDFIIKAYSSARLKGHEFELVIAGNCNENVSHTEELKKLEHQLGLRGKIRWLGFIDEKTKGPVFESADVFVHASYSEGMAISILEAMSYGIPVVATPGCFMDEASESGAVIVCDQDAEAISASMISLLQNAEASRSVGAKGADYVKRVHSWPEIAENILAVYSQFRKT